jgi:RimJ/RimL family protein N-acetyltransferase
VSRAARDPLANLFLLDLAAGLGRPPSPGDVPPELAGLFRGRELLAVVALRPCIVLERDLAPEALQALLPFLLEVEGGLVKSALAEVDALWRALVADGRRAVVDRRETAYRLERRHLVAADAAPGARVRPATAADLEPLVQAARASLREEGRPDPFDGDPEGFRRWVRGRVTRASVVETADGIAWVGYADVRRTEGWLLQGVYTFPAARRHGHARAGVAALCHEAFAAGADHVQLAVVEGNTAAERLYQGLGFRPFDVLRTILFEPGGGRGA